MGYWRYCRHIILATIITLAIFIINIYAPSPNSNIEKYYQNELILYENYFYNTFNSKIKYSGQIYFSKNIAINLYAVCYPGPMWLTNIKINYERWKFLDIYAKEELIFHELGHCLYWLNHDNDLIELKVKNKFRTCPKSIMIGTWDIMDGCYKYNRDYYIKELQTKINLKRGDL